MVWFIDSNPPTWILVILFLACIIVIWIVGLIIKHYVRRARHRITLGAINGMNLLITFLQVLSLLIIGSIIFEIDSSAILGFSALFGTAIGFAMAVVIGNIVAGFYLITVRPFGIGDLIKVNKTEGIVMEIGLNYTKLLQMDHTIVLIPNKSLLDANLLNCSIQLKDLRERAEEGFEIGYQALMDDVEEAHLKANKITGELAETILGGKEIVRYPFTVQLKLNIVSPDIPMATVNKRMSKLLDRWDKKTGYRPRYFYNKYIFRQDVRIILIVDDPHLIIDYSSEFLEDLYVTVFEELHVKEAV
jgi:small-conductance mechanosensitive channel